jgi:hypothetical protein
MKYRDHKGGINESMATVQEMQSPQQLMRHLQQVYGDVPVFGFKHIGYDERTGWDTYYVMAVIVGQEIPFVAGMSDTDKF